MSPLQRRKAGSLGYAALRKRVKPFWKGIQFDSVGEMECAKKILIHPRRGVNFQFRIGRKRIDFFPQQEDKMFQNCFVEYHPEFRLGDTQIKGMSYFLSRRKILDESGFQKYKLIIISDLEEI